MRKNIKTKNNIIVALRPYIIGELMVAKPKTPPKKSAKCTQAQKKYKKRAKPDDAKLEVLEFVEDDEDEEQQFDVVPRGGKMSSGLLTSERNKIRETIVKKKLMS